MEIREARPEEYPEVGEVVALAYAPFGRPGDQDWDKHLALVRRVADRAQRTVVLAAVEAGRILGSATIELDGVIGDDERELPPDWAFVRMVGTHPEVRGRGIGKALMRDVIERVHRAGRRHLGLRTTPPMTIAQRMYESLGFERDPSLDYDDGDVRLIGYRLDLGG